MFQQLRLLINEPSVHRRVTLTHVDASRGMVLWRTLGGGVQCREEKRTCGTPVSTGC